MLGSMLSCKGRYHGVAEDQMVPAKCSGVNATAQKGEGVHYQ